MNQEFWNNIDTLIDGSTIKIDRPKGSAHPMYPDYIYPHNYGYLRDTSSTDGAELDCWVGSVESRQKIVTGIIATIDSKKRDSEMKILINCSESDMKEILACQNRGSMNGLLIKRIT